jgi:hypothetical protein
MRHARQRRPSLLRAWQRRARGGAGGNTCLGPCTTHRGGSLPATAHLRHGLPRLFVAVQARPARLAASPGTFSPACAPHTSPPPTVALRQRLPAFVVALQRRLLPARKTSPSCTLQRGGSLFRKAQFAHRPPSTFLAPHRRLFLFVGIASPMLPARACEMGARSMGPAQPSSQISAD